MNLLLHPYLDQLYAKYSLSHYGDDDSEQYIFLSSKAGSTNQASARGSYCNETKIGRINSIRGSGVGHELMILILIEMYYAKVQTIHLEATPLLTLNKEQSTLPYLLDFYKGYGFKINDLSSDPRYPHRVAMILDNWESLLRQVQRYINSITPQT